MYVFYLGERVVDINLQLVVDTEFDSDLLNRSSNKFLYMEEKVKSSVS